MKFVLVILITFLFSIKIMAQDTTRIIINNIKTAQVIINNDETTALLVIKKNSLIKLRSIYVQVSGELINSEIYTRTLEISDEPGITLNEIKNKPGWFDITKTNVKKQLVAGKTITLSLLMNPANPMMSFPSRMVFVGKLVMN